jgi:ABC-2 type transport system permease protein
MHGPQLAAVYLTGAVTHKASMPAGLWVITGLCVWAGSLLFAAFGLFAGYLLPTENVAQVLTLALTLCSFAGGLFIPFSQFSPTCRTSPGSRRCTGSASSSTTR